MLNRQKIKKLFLTLLTTLEIILLTLGNFSVAQAVHIPSTEDILNDLHIDIGNAQEGGEYGNVSSTKETATSVSLMFSPTNPKVGDKITATALPIGFMSSKDNLYFTWFLKRKDCDIKPKNYDPEKDYGSDFLSDDTSGVIRTEKDCDSDGDGLITVNDWKVDAQKMIAQNGFTPDLGGKYTDLNDFYTIHDNLNETEDSDGYQAWQGGVDAERMPSHCYGFHGTNGLAYELLKNNKLSGATPMCADGKTEAICGVTRQFILKNPDYDWCKCSPGTTGHPDPYANCWSLNSKTTPDPDDDLNVNDPSDQDCYLVGGVTTCDWEGNLCTYDSSIGLWHFDCESKTDGHFGCENLPSVKPRCVEIKNGRMGVQSAEWDQYIADKKLAAICGEDVDQDGLEDTPGSGITRNGYTNRMIAMCPKSGGALGSHWPPTPLEDHITDNEYSSKLASSQTYPPAIQMGKSYYDYRDSGSTPLSNLPICSCDHEQIYYSNFAGADDKPYIEACDNGEVIVGQDLLCGSGRIASTTEQFHTFPWTNLNEAKYSRDNYYEWSRDYGGINSDKRDRGEFDYRYGNKTGNGEFDINEEQKWETDPRNPSTAGNGKPDEANISGAGADTFSWKYEEGDEIGVSVEGASVMPTKYSDSSRMIFWGFSQGSTLTTNQSQKDRAACQPLIRGEYLPSSDKTGNQQVSIPVGFLDFDKCIANSTIAPVSGGGGLGGGQPTQMEAELSVSPDNPVNDESGDNTGDILDIQSSVKNASKGESDLYYSWEIQKLAPVPVNGVSIQPLERDWTPNTNFCGKGIAYCSQPEEANCCPFLDENKKKLKVVGTGLTNLNFRLNLPTTEFNENGDLYLNVKLTIRESETDSNTPNSRVGRANAVVKVSSTSNRISIFKPEIIGGAGNEQLTEPATDASICKTGADRYICPVSKNEIIGLKVPATADRGSTTGEPLTNFNWKLNGKALDCDLTMSNKCANDQGTAYNFIPITGNAGDTLTVEVKSSNVAGSSTTATGRSIALVQKFKIVEPSIEIISPDNSATAKELGSFVDVTKDYDDPSRTSAKDVSSSVLETTAGNNVTLGLQYIPEYVKNSITFENWDVDGQRTNNFTAGSVGTVHNVKAWVSYDRPTAQNVILSRNFNVSPSELKNKVISTSIQIEVNQEANATTMIKKSTRFLASLLDKIPVQTMFLIRLFLSVLLVVALTGIIFAFFPEVQYDEKKY